MKILIAILLACSLDAATYYVATNGVDANPCSATAPCATLQRGVNVARAGDTVLVRNGTYGPAGAGNGQFAVNINSAGITLQAENKLGAVLDCQNTCYGYIYLGAGSADLVIEGFDIKNGYSSGIHANSGGAKNVTIRGNHIHHIGNRVASENYGLVGIYTDTAAVMIVENNEIDHVGRSNDTGNSYDHGLYYHGNLTVRGNVFHHSLSGWHIQTSNGFQGSIEGNTFDGQNLYPGKYGQIQLWETAGGPFKISRNIFSLPGGSPITYWQTSIANCTVDANFTTAGTMSDYPGCKSVNPVLNTLPKFVNVSANDYHLQVGSPAAGYGAFPVPVGPPPLIPCSSVWIGPGGKQITSTWMSEKCP